MTKNTWHIIQEPGHYTLSRRLPVRFDFCSEALFPELSPRQLAHQIRQDLWREFKHLRGFTPVIDILSVKNGLRVRAGGCMLSGQKFPADSQDKIHTLLHDTSRRSRWSVWARLRGTS